MRVCAIVQARVGSSRLPGKVLLPLAADCTLLSLIVERVSRAQSLDDVIVATTTAAQDNDVELWCSTENVLCYRGSEHDVLGRFRHCAIQHDADVIVRITADDPFKDPDIIDEAVATFLELKPDLVSNTSPPSWPEGLDVEVISRAALELAHAKCVLPEEREHVTAHFYKNPEKFRIHHFGWKCDLSHLRWTVDTREDYHFAREILCRIPSDDHSFSWLDVLELVSQDPALIAINQHVERSAHYRQRPT